VVGGSAPDALPPWWLLEVESGGGGDHGSVAAVDGGDDFLGVDALEVDRGGAEVGVAELALDDVQRHAFAGELERMGVAELVRREPAAHPGLDGESVKLEAHGGA
jgi:hypothetical protein